MSDRNEVIVFGGGCFWCTETIFQQLKGVNRVVSGYTGGTTKNPTYTQVSSGTTNHAEVIQIEFDPTVIPYEVLLDIFFHTHNPTSLNRQGADTGTQYRSVILYSNNKQKETAEKFIEKLAKSGEFTNRIVTELKPLETFYPAEDYHQNFYTKNYDQPYCQLVISPKLTHLREQYSDKLKIQESYSP